jgi:GNAT superfamily N-acetyltransferase
MSKCLEKIGDILVLEEIPTSEEHYNLWKGAGGLTLPPRPENSKALLNSWYSILLRDSSTIDNKAIGMGRVVGDGMFLYIVDMAILSTYQRRGLGGKILEKLLIKVDKEAPRARLALEGDPPGVPLYLKHGFLHQTFSKSMVRSTYFPAGPQPE